MREGKSGSAIPSPLIDDLDYLLHCLVKLSIPAELRLSQLHGSSRQCVFQPVISFGLCVNRSPSAFLSFINLSDFLIGCWHPFCLSTIVEAREFGSHDFNRIWGSKLSKCLYVFAALNQKLQIYGHTSCLLGTLLGTKKDKGIHCNI